MSQLRSKVMVKKIKEKEDLIPAKQIISGVYLKEKNWITSVDNQIKAGEIESIQGNHPNVSWFMAEVNGKPAGLLRLLYDPPMELPEEYQVSLHEGIDLKQLEASGKFVEIGRFMILPEYRRNIRVSLQLMRAGIQEVVSRDYTHFITDVFEGEKHSPYRFHTKLLGFKVIGTHVHGDLHCNCTRIILVLDILKAYVRIRDRKNKFYETLLKGMKDLFESKLSRNRKVYL